MLIRISHIFKIKQLSIKL